MQHPLLTLLFGAVLFLGTAMLTLDHVCAHQSAGGAKSGAAASRRFQTEDERAVVIVGYSSKDRDVKVRANEDSKDDTFQVRVYDVEGNLLFEAPVPPGTDVTVGVPKGGRVVVADDDSHEDDESGVSGTYDLL